MEGSKFYFIGLVWLGMSFFIPYMLPYAVGFIVIGLIMGVDKDSGDDQ